jgi:hypothetical protein
MMKPIAKADPQPNQVLIDLGPQDGEAAVLSLLAARDGENWVVACGSLLTMPAEVAEMSWPAWGEHQPETRGRRGVARAEDLGAVFDEEPFPDLRIIRAVIERDEWSARVEEIKAGSLVLKGGAFRLDLDGLTAGKLFAQDGLSEAHQVLEGAKRPVLGVATGLQAPELPHSEEFWVRGGTGKPMMEQTREELQGKETFHNWPEKLLGIKWLGTLEFAPPSCFVIGKAQSKIWIADVLPDYENKQIKIVLAWDAERVDPFSCSVLLRAERDGAAMLARHWKISDLPGENKRETERKEARELAWNERTIEVRLPRGPRRTDFGVSLFGPDGWLADERPVARRIERIEMEVGIMGASGPASKSLIGDPDPAPNENERDQATVVTRELEEETRAVAARRRLATTGELRRYLRWRFSARAGELLVLDRYLFEGKEIEEVEPVVEFLAGFARPIRALIAKNSPFIGDLLKPHPHIQVRKTSPKKFHDRLWIAGESAVLVGTSVNQFLREDSVPATSAVDLPFADGAAWRQQFETWWEAAKVL